VSRAWRRFGSGALRDNQKAMPFGRFLGLVLVFAVCAGAEKSRSTFYPKLLTERARANAERHPWAREQVRQLVEGTAPWMKLSDEELWAAVFGAEIDRSHSVWSSGYCPACRRPVLMYAWEIDAWRQPWKVRCPHCRELFPKNDFQKYYQSGLNRHGVFEQRLADKRLLFNPEFPNPADAKHQFGVDDGHGYAEGDKRWWFVGAYLRYGQWEQVVLGGITKLAAAYVVTGNPVYARKAAILLDRLADLFPTFDYAQQGLVYERRRYGGGVAGYVSYSIDSAYDVRKLALAYDQIFEGIQTDRQLVDFLARQAAAYQLDNPKQSFAGIQRNIEERILRDVLRNPHKIHTNYPGTEGTLAIIESILDWPASRPRVEALIEEIVARTTEVDGLSGEKGLNSYATLGPHYLAYLLEHFLRADLGLLDGLLARHPGLRETYRFFVDTWVGRQYYPISGDAGAFAVRSEEYAGLPLKPQAGRYGSDLPVSPYTFLWRLYRATSDPLYLQIFHLGLEKYGEQAARDLFAADPDQPLREARDAVARHGAWPAPRSVLKRDWRLALLRSPRAPDAAVWLDFDSVPQSRLKSHYHFDAMNLGLFAKGLDLLPEFGYPAVQFGDWHTKQALWHKKTIVHNTVVVDGRDQSGGDARATLWGDGQLLRVVRASSPAQYGGRQYERTVAMADLNPGNFYVLDVFRVAGGREHAFLLRSHFAPILAPELKWTPAPAWGDTELLRAFETDRQPPPVWRVDFEAQNRMGYLPAGGRAGLRYTSLTRGAEVLRCETWTVRNATSSEQFWIPTLIVRRSGLSSELVSTFAGVLEPYEARPAIASVSRHPLLTTGGARWGDAHVAVEVEHPTGNDTWIAADVENPLSQSPSLYHDATLVEPRRGIQLRGEFAWVRRNRQGAIEAMALAGGDLLVAGTAELRLRHPVDFLEVHFTAAGSRVVAGSADAIALLRR
jgi:hypothetical protein